MKYCSRVAAGESETNDTSSRSLLTSPPTADVHTLSTNGSSSSMQKSSIQAGNGQREMSQNSQQRIPRDVPFSLDGTFSVNPAFLEVIRKVNGVDLSKTIFTYKEVGIYINMVLYGLKLDNM